MSRKIITIYTDSTNPTRYVMSTFNRPDKQISVELTANPDNAHDFVTKENAEKILTRIFNPWERNYMVKKITVRQPIRISNIDDLIN